MKKIFIILFIICVIVLSLATLLVKNQSTDSKIDLLKHRFSKKHIPSVDHTKFTILQQQFKTPQEVTKACLSCHTERGKEMMHTSHWQWSRKEFIKDRGVVTLGKKNILNNFCIGISGSEQSCNRCHAGYGWGDKKILALPVAIQKRILQKALAQLRPSDTHENFTQSEEILKALRSTKNKNQTVKCAGLKMTRYGDKIILE